MKKSRSRKLLIFSVVLILAASCLTVACILIPTRGMEPPAKEFVSYMLAHTDEASEDFKECGIMFAAADGTDTLSVTFPDGRCFYYQSVAHHDDQLVKIECSVERVNGRETLTGCLEVEMRSKTEANVAVESTTESYPEVRVLNYILPEFDKYSHTFKSEDTAQRISRWISTEELSALYKEGKELEEILSGYCQLKSHGVGLGLYQYTSPYEEMKLHIESNDKGGAADAGNG